MASLIYRQQKDKHLSPCTGNDTRGHVVIWGQELWCFSPLLSLRRMVHPTFWLSNCRHWGEEGTRPASRGGMRGQAAPEAGTPRDCPASVDGEPREKEPSSWVPREPPWGQQLQPSHQCRSPVPGPGHTGAEVLGPGGRSGPRQAEAHA